MQLKHALLPIAVLAGSGIFLAKRQSAAVEKRQHMAIYRETIATVAQHRAENLAAASAKAAADAKNPAPAAAPVTRESIDLKALAKGMADMRNGGGMPDMQAMLKLQKAILGLSTEDLSGLIADAGKLEIPASQKNSLLVMLLQGLGQKDAKSAVLAAQAVSQGLSGNDRTTITMGGIQPAFAQWAQKDSAAALAWYDEQRAAGQFENKGLNEVSMEQCQFESALLPGLAARDPAAAHDRLMAMPEAQRASVLSQNPGFGADTASRKAFAALVRGTLAPDKQADTLANVASGLGRGADWTKVSDFITDVGATPAEKSKILPQVVGTSLREQVWSGGELPTVENTAALRKWLDGQEPGSSGRAMGESLAAITGSGKFNQGEAVALISRLYDESPSDDLISVFIEKSAGKVNTGLYENLTAKIKDPEKRKATLDRLSSRK